MGKTTAAGMFADRGIPVHESDAAVHSIYRGRAVDAIGAEFPEAIVSGEVSREKLSQRVAGDPDALAKLEAIVHPLVAEHRDEFIRTRARNGDRFVVLDIPLLFESGLDREIKTILVVTAPANIQKQRVLGRPGMTDEKWALLIQRQMPDLEKRRRAHFLIDTSREFPFTERQVDAVLRALQGTR